MPDLEKSRVSRNGMIGQPVAMNIVEHEPNPDLPAQLAENN